MPPTAADWHIRLYIYEVLVERGQAPDTQAIAAQFAISELEARRSLRRLHEAHAIVLQNGGDNILMAHPLSAAPTDYRVLVDRVALYANCAWDSLGIPAMLGRDAQIEARHPLTRESAYYSIEDGQLRQAGGGIVHFALPFRQWYDDIVET